MPILGVTHRVKMEVSATSWGSMKSLSLQFLSFLQSQTDEWTHHMDKSIRSYGFENAGNLEFQEEADIDVFYSKVSKSKICLVGDFHTFSP
jgi:hypothetical protein